MPFGAGVLFHFDPQFGHPFLCLGGEPLGVELFSELAESVFHVAFSLKAGVGFLDVLGVGGIGCNLEGALLGVAECSVLAGYPEVAVRSVGVQYLEEQGLLPVIEFLPYTGYFLGVLLLCTCCLYGGCQACGHEQDAGG